MGGVGRREEMRMARLEAVERLAARPVAGAEVGVEGAQERLHADEGAAELGAAAWGDIGRRHAGEETEAGAGRGREVAVDDRGDPV